MNNINVNTDDNITMTIEGLSIVPKINGNTSAPNITNPNPTSTLNEAKRQFLVHHTCPPLEDQKISELLNQIDLTA